MAAITKCVKRSISESTKDVVKRICMLKPMEAEHQTIHLNPGANTVGRSRETGIRDTNCSKQQLQLFVDMDKARVKLTVLGVNPCGVNGFMTMHDTECELSHGDIVEIVYGRHPFEIVFKPPPEGSKKFKKIDEGMTESRTESTSESWDSVDDGKVLVFTSAGVRPSEKIAAYDMDGTLIKTKSGNVFPKNIDDWEIIYPDVPGKLKQLHGDGFKICIFTNQGGIAKGKVDLDEFKGKIKRIIKRLGVPVQAFVAIADGYYRKPLPGMWEHLVEEKNNGVRVQFDKCFYVGDAAGRVDISSGPNKRKKDHSLADRFFASNIGVSFYTPEEHFLNKKKENYSKPEFDPRENCDDLPLFDPEGTKIPSDKMEMVIMVGMPGSGKSFFCKQNLAPLGYVIASSDTLGSVKACLKACENALVEGKSCVVDNTNVDVDSRKKFISLAEKLQVPCRCFVMNVTLSQMRHNIAFRQLTDTKHSKINEMVINMMKKKYKEPSQDEGFVEIAKVNVKPHFTNDNEKRLYKLYLVEK